MVNLYTLVHKTMWQLTITRLDNGYLLKDTGHNDELEEVPKEWVIEDCDEYDRGDDSLKSGETLLWEVMEFFGFGGSKNDPERLRIVREKQ